MMFKSTVVRTTVLIVIKVLPFVSQETSGQRVSESFFPYL